MDRESRRKPLVVLLLLLPAAWLMLHRRPIQSSAPPAAPNPNQPLAMLWAWETPEDLTTLDPAHTGVAFLARTVTLTQTGVTVQPRRQPLRLAPDTFLTAVVRIETGPGFSPTPTTATEAARNIAAAASLPNVRALQVDFDATASQRDLYAAILRDLRKQLPARIPLSITALVSWCGPHSWINTLRTSALIAAPPIDEAVPMFFRMGGPASTRAAAPRTTAALAEPLCQTSLGLSTDEAWPTLTPPTRLYLFHPGPWTQQDIAAVNKQEYEQLKQANESTFLTPNPLPLTPNP
jgi:hypothetical protein